MSNFKIPYEEFIRDLKERLNEVYGEDAYEFSTQLKAGDNEIEILLIKVGTICPIIKIREVYKQLQETDIVNEAMCAIEDYLRDAEDAFNSKELYSIIQDFEKAKSRITFRVLNFSSNKEYLKDVVYVRVLDLVLAFQILVNELESKVAYILIRNNHKDIWGVSTECIYNTAMENVRKRFVSCKCIDEVLYSLTYDDMYAENDNLCYVLSDEKAYGASAMFYPDVLKRCSESLADGGDLVILPSSIYEVLLLPADKVDLNNLKEAVREVNSNILMQGEFLSNNVYRYDSKLNKIFIVK